MQVSKKKPLVKKTFQDVGDISIRITINPETRWREIGLVRDAGMLITSDRKNMFPSLKRIPAHWCGFTAIIECQSKGKSLLRQAESPRHDHISADYIRGADVRASTEEKFKEIGDWCLEEIRKLAEPDLGSESVNVDELAQLLGVGGDTTLEAGKEVPDEDGDPVVSEPEKILRSPNQYKKTIVKKAIEDLVESIVDDETADDAEEVERTDKKIDKKTDKKRQVRAVPQSLMQARFRTGSKATHSVIVSFDYPEGNPSKIELNAIGEDGIRYLMGVSEAVYDNKSLSVENDLIILPNTDQERQSIEIFTRDPVQNKSFDLRFIK